MLRQEKQYTYTFKIGLSLEMESPDWKYLKKYMKTDATKGHKKKPPPGCDEWSGAPQIAKNGQQEQ